MVQHLDRDGFVILDSAFDPGLLQRLKAALSERLCWDQWRPEIGKFRHENTPAETNAAHVLGVEGIPEAMAIANDPRILAIVSEYLGCMPTIDYILAWWSLPGRTGPIQEQFFHRDNPSVRFLKLFIYLSDVGETEGPHTFVQRSHRSREFLRPPGKRFSDETVEAACGSERIKRFTGPFGTTFLEDTYGLHKGEMPTGDARLIFQVTYNTLRSPPPLKKMAWQELAASSPFDDETVEARKV